MYRYLVSLMIKRSSRLIKDRCERISTLKHLYQALTFDAATAFAGAKDTYGRARRLNFIVCLCFRWVSKLSLRPIVRLTLKTNVKICELSCFYLV